MTKSISAQVGATHFKFRHLQESGASQIQTPVLNLIYLKRCWLDMSKLKNFDTKIWLVAVDHPGHFVLPCTKIVFPVIEQK
jgi:hypothetical protein